MNFEEIAKTHTTEQAMVVVERCKRCFTDKENEDITVLKQELAALDYYNKIQDRDNSTKTLFNHFLEKVKAHQKTMQKEHDICSANDRKVALAFVLAAINDCLVKVKGENKYD